MTLIRNFLRVIRKNKTDFFINLAGLSVAMVVFIFISLYIENEFTFDNYHKDASRVFRLTTSLTSPSGQNTNMALANPPFAQILKNQCPEIENFACVETEGSYTLKYNDHEFENINLRKATPSIFSIFNYPANLGKREEFLNSPNTIVLTESLSKNIFGNTPPLGQRITIGKMDYDVTGVLKDLPSNTDLQFSGLIASEFDGTGELVDWGDYYVYLKTASLDIAGLSNKIEKIAAEKYTDLLKQIGGFKLVHHLQPLQSIHFDNSLLADSPKGNKTTVYVFSVIALMILIIAGINYNNLTMAQLEKREKEFSIRKILGSGKSRIIYTIIGESVLNVLLAAAISILVAALLTDRFNTFSGKDFNFQSIARLLPPILAGFIFMGILSGIYPAFKTVRKTLTKKSSFSLFGKSLVTFQNVVAIAMVAGLFIIWSQIRYMKNAELGFDKKQLLAVVIPPEPEKFPGKEVLKQEFSTLTGVESFAFGGGGTNLGSTGNWLKAITANMDDEGNDIQFILHQPQIDGNYIDLFGIELVEGRNFTGNMATDSVKSVIINESYAKSMGWTEPLGKILDETPPQTIIGVVKDFHFDALNNPIEPLKFTMLNGQPAFFFIKTEPKNIKAIQQKWEKLFPDESFNYQFMDQHMASLYKQNEKDMAVFSYLTLIAILISCLGLYGLASHFITNRTKEIGIRKVNGARISEVLFMLNKDFVKWVAIAFIIATPIAYYAMHKWLENYAYKTELSWWIFALAGLLALGIALLTVSWQSWRAATSNPVEALRYE